ncbi:unnamed protein product [Rotaria magnacalcarata]|uniref:Endonuclease/exonuclease/phosphatase domain-containing protein n=1 Tax=Rotaria magnacalcarata TaxID=392030 RepID=A0A817A9R3_9BILA|nr:unnamed protein product [Rotaria magnacalcarata]
MNQFNIYKFTELKNKLEIFTSNWNNFDHKLALKMIEEWCWTYPRQTLFSKWQNHHQQVQPTSNNLSVLHYNIRNFYKNQCDLLDMIERYNPNIISINELGTDVPIKKIKNLLFSYDVFKAQGSNSHAGVVVAVAKQLHATAVTHQQINIITVILKINNKSYTFTSLYSPPTEDLPLEILSEILKKCKSNIIVGDLNAKHEQWGCSLRNKKGRDLNQWLQMNNLVVYT